MARSRRTLGVSAALLTLGLGLAACSGTDAGVGASGDASPEALDAALEEGGTITFWSWTPSAQVQADAFMAQYPDVTVEVVSTGGSSEQNLNLQNAITAGSGVPDVASMEYQTIPQFQLPGALADLTDYGFAELEDLYTASTWSAVTPNSGIWALPQDSGPMAMFYNADVFDEAGVEVPLTWDEYIAAGEAIVADDPSRCLLADSGDAGFVTSMIWQAGGTPFAVEGETVTIDLQDEGAQRWTETWDRLLAADLNCETSEWSDEYFASISDGTIATVLSGAWMPGVFENSAPGGAGQWRVATMPTYDGTPVNSENGGSGAVVLADAPNPALGAAFLRWLNGDQASVEVFLASGGFPATVENLQDPAFVELESEYFGGQTINEVLIEGIDPVLPGWQYLPWQSYANSIGGETVGQSYVRGTSLDEGLAAWQDANVAYGEGQGFTVVSD